MGSSTISGLEEHYRATEQLAEAQERISNIREVITAAEQFHEGSPEAGLAGFLELVALITEPEAHRGRDRKERVTLMTLHAAKGLEFPVVFIVGCEDGVLPLKRMGESADLEEERRLMYVGITRAMTLLHLSRARCRMQYGQSYRYPPSQFLDEIPADCFRKKDATGRHAVPEAGARLDGGRALAAAAKAGLIRRGSEIKAPAAQIGEPLESDPYQAGERVLHAMFGVGRVLGLKGPPDARSIIIDFDERGRLELQLSFVGGKLSRA